MVAGGVVAVRNTIEYALVGSKVLAMESDKREVWRVVVGFLVNSPETLSFVLAMRYSGALCPPAVAVAVQYGQT